MSHFKLGCGVCLFPAVAPTPAAMRIIMVDEHHRNKEHGQPLTRVIERHLALQGYKSLHTKSTPAALRFYENLGFTPMTFDAPDGYEGGPEDIAMGKILQI